MKPIQTWGIFKYIKPEYKNTYIFFSFFLSMMMVTEIFEYIKMTIFPKLLVIIIILIGSLGCGLYAYIAHKKEI